MLLVRRLLLHLLFDHGVRALRVLAAEVWVAGRLRWVNAIILQGVRLTAASLVKPGIMHMLILSLAKRCLLATVHSGVTEG